MLYLLIGKVQHNQPIDYGQLTRVEAGEQLTGRPYNSTNECGRREHGEGPKPRPTAREWTHILYILSYLHSGVVAN